MLFKRRNSASNEYFKSLLTIKNQISLGNRTFRFILKIPAIWRVIFFWKTENNLIFYKHEKCLVQGPVMLHVSGCVCSQRCISAWRTGEHPGPGHRRTGFLLMQVTQEMCLYIRFWTRFSSLQEYVGGVRIQSFRMFPLWF